MTRWPIIIALTLGGLGCLALVVCGCSPSAYAQRQDRAMELYDVAQERVTVQLGQDDAAALARSTTVGAAQDGLAAVRQRYEAALNGLIAAQRSYEHGGIDMVPSVCAALALARAVGIAIDDEGLCAVPTCYGADIDIPRGTVLRTP